MPNASFVFKQFKVEQDKCAMKVNTDAVLLGAWVIPNGSTNILDIGTGTGVIALMLAQKSNAQILAIDIDKHATEQAHLNVKSSIFKNIIVQHISFQELSETTAYKFDLIVTNPPYFIDSLKSQDENRKIARHNQNLSFTDILSGAKKLLTENGKLCLILPTKEASIFREEAKEKGLYLSKLLRIKTRADNSNEKRHIMLFEFKQTEFSEATLIIEGEKAGTYSEAYKMLTRDYYINF
ncbi:MAG: methyltransferase [Sphingobacteriaceae bacterium]|nr:methyltransferase [Sphingobacteriaceae bacterium]